jgi:SAM-dependent methyltransferase
MLGQSYTERLAREKEVFAGQDALHEDLPPSFHYWSNRHVLPKLAELGVSSLDEFVLTPLEKAARSRNGELVVLSVGSGNGNLELGWLAQLRSRGVDNVRLRLLELNPGMQERAAALAAGLDLADRTELLIADFNTWRADAEHDVAIGWHALHHVVDLEHFYGQIVESLAADGVLLVNDIIGRNGHRRWPEALETIERIWSTLPPELRRNSVTGQVDDTYCDLDCATDGFEGIRAQDVLPRLLDVLEPGLFLTFSNVIDPFVDRVYGHNFDLGTTAHRMIIEDLGRLDDTLIDLGVVTPTHLLGSFHPHSVPLRCYRDRTPRRAVRDPSRQDLARRVSYDPAACDPAGLVTGGAVIGRMNGVDQDQWAAPVVDFPFLPHADTDIVEIVTFVPDWMGSAGSVEVQVDGQRAGSVAVTQGRCTGRVAAPMRAGAVVSIALVADWSVIPSQVGAGHDVRRLSYVLVGWRSAEQT